MAAPVYVNAGTGVIIASGSSAVTLASTTAGNVIILQVLRDGTASAVTLSAHSNVENLAGTDSAITDLSLLQPVGSPTAAAQSLYIGRSLGGTVSITVATAGDDLYCRIYEFSGVNTGTTLAAVTEAITNGAGLAAAIADTGITTTGADRLALQFVAVDDDNPVGPFTGMTGGTWAEAVAEFASATGTDGCIQLQFGVTPTVESLPATAFGLQVGNVTNATQVAYPFVAAATGVADIIAPFAAVGSPSDDAIIEIQTDSGGAPGTVVGSSVTLNVTGAQADYHWRVAAPLTSGLTYWIVSRRTGAISGTAYYEWGYVSGTGGNGGLRWNGSSWTNAFGHQLAFAVVANGLTAAGTINGGSYTMAASDNWGVIGLALIPPASGTAHTSSPADTLALADAQAKARGLGRVDTLALADAFARVATYARAVADPVALADTATLAKTIPKTAADTVALSDSLTAVKSRQLALSDTVTLADSATSSKTIPKSVTDSLALTDARLIGQGQAVADTLTVADAASSAKTIPKSIADTVTLADATTRAKAAPKALADTVALADSLSRVATYNRAPADQVTLADSTARAKTFARAVTDSVALTDNCSPSLGVGSVDHTRSIDDTVAVADTLTAAEADALAISDTVAVADSFARTATYVRTAADAVALADQLARAVAAARSVADSVALADTATPNKTTGSTSHTRDINDTVALADSLTRVKTIAKALADTLALTDSAARAKAMQKVLTDTLVLADLFARVTAASRAATDSVALTDAVARAATVARALADTLTLTDQAAASIGQGVTIDDTVTVADAVNVEQGVSLAHTRNIDDLVAVTDYTETVPVLGGGADGHIDFPAIGTITRPARGRPVTAGRGRIDTADRGQLVTTGGGS